MSDDGSGRSARTVPGTEGVNHFLHDGVGEGNKSFETADNDAIKYIERSMTIDDTAEDSSAENDRTVGILSKETPTDLNLCPLNHGTVQRSGDECLLDVRMHGYCIYTLVQ